jgi:hypothetical protein
MFKISAVLFASVVVAAGSAVVPGISPARADWDEEAYMNKTLESREDDSVGDHFFHVEWSVAPAPDGHARITGYVYNDYGDDATSVELQINEMDGSGHRVERLLEPVRGPIPAGSRASFDFKVPASASYQVSVASFDFVEMAN